MAPDTATSAPTDRSVPPRAMTSVMPMAMMVISAERFRMSIRLP